MRYHGDHHVLPLIGPLTVGTLHEMKISLKNTKMQGPYQ